MSIKNSNTLPKQEFLLFSILKSSIKFLFTYKLTFFVLYVVNFIFITIFSFINGGWTNSLSIIWLILYYVYWCVFIRFVQMRPPYFSLIRILNGLVPVSKIMFINISICLIFLVAPYIPLFMGFKDNYLEFFEQYMSLLEENNGFFSKILLYIIMLLLSPITIVRPYLAWISSLIGKSRSIVDAYKKTRGHYIKFIVFSFVISIFFLLSHYVDVIYNQYTLIAVASILPIYFNIVFIKMYKLFYKKRRTAKKKA